MPGLHMTAHKLVAAAGLVRAHVVNFLEGRIVVTQRICQTLLQNPLSPEAQDKCLGCMLGAV